jgi:type I restriction enzyme M protein
VPVAEIRANKYDLSISRYKPIEHAEVEYEKPEVIMGKVLELENAIAKDVEEIRRIVAR